MGFLSSIFTWWNGATWGTSLFTRRFGGKMGEDQWGNVYFQAKKPDGMGWTRRWVIYKGANDASRVPPEWYSWLAGQSEDVPDKSLPPARSWEQPPVPNLTGTKQAYRMPGALESGGVRAASTGDYEAWSPDAA